MSGQPDHSLRRLVRAAVQHTDVLDSPEPEHGPDYHERFMATDEELREAALAYTRGLSPNDRRRLAL